MTAKVCASALLVGFMTVVSAESAVSDDKNYASQLQLKNCGVYDFRKVSLQRKAVGSSSWKEIASKETTVQTGWAICFDASQWDVFKPGDQARLKGFIKGSESKKCDSTNYDVPPDQGGKGLRRNLRMDGTATLNNGCRSHGYKELWESSKCGKHGTKIEHNC